MRVLLVAEDPRLPEGGIARYAVPVAERLARRGHEIHYLHSGGYAGDYDWTFRRRWRSETLDGVRYHRLVNARSIGMHMGRPELDVSSDDGEWIARRVRAIQPDVIHVHSFVGVPFETMRDLADVAPVFVTLHDFGLICQRRTLVRGDGRVSTRYDEQVECARCVDDIDPARFRLRARVQRTPGAIRLLHALERRSGIDVTVTKHRSGAAAAGGNGEAASYRRRLRAGVDAVNAYASGVLAVSNAVRDVLLRVGVRPELVRVVHIGSGSAERLDPLPLPCAHGAPVTFLYLGGLVPHKGAHVLLAAASRLDPPVRLLVTGYVHDPEYQAEIDRVAPPSVEFVGRYTSEDLPRLLARADVVVAPAIGPDTSPQTVLEALAAGRPVVGSRIGGIPDFVLDGVNGRLFDAGDVEELAGILRELRDPARVAELAGGTQPPKRVDVHTDELEELYAGAR